MQLAVPRPPVHTRPLQVAAFNSLFEMPMPDVSQHIISANEWSFNSLFEMRGREAALTPDLAYDSFNSLFEMPLRRLDEAQHISHGQAFNSLFEMPLRWGHVCGFWYSLLSILYLRCTAGRCGHLA